MNWNPEEHYKNHQVATDYDQARFSSFLGRVFNGLEKRAIVKCFSRVLKGVMIADAPSGTGRLADALLTAGYRVHGLDISAEMLRVAQERLRRYEGRFTCQVVDIKNLPPDTPKYDAALCARVLMHFPLDQKIQFLAGVTRLSRGPVIINLGLDSRYQRFRRRVTRFLGHRSPARFPISNRDIKLLLHNTGLREVKRYRLFSLMSEAVYLVAERTVPDRDPL